ncbi:MAG: transcription elongation factor GreB [Pseudobdellovibrionaceae bacterium]|nr:transcription elongation factor GreB [Bdellovibrionales bacterium]USN47944.1 MAG: transcription elongation factor GreB [Pseudobdellovibrionaceae bacterium]
MAKTKNYITPNGFAALRKEADHLHRIERPKVVETVAWAAGNGDRSENGDYIYGKRRLREIDRRLRYLAQRMDAAEVVEPPKNPKKVVFGTSVTIETEEGSEKTYQIVGEDEIDVDGNKISWKSPMAKALLGRQVDDEVQVKLPKKEIWLTIIAIT